VLPLRSPSSERTSAGVQSNAYCHLTKRTRPADPDRDRPRATDDFASLQRRRLPGRDAARAISPVPARGGSQDRSSRLARPVRNRTAGRTLRGQEANHGENIGRIDTAHGIARLLRSGPQRAVARGVGRSCAPLAHKRTNIKASTRAPPRDRASALPRPISHWPGSP
jgi:hypothetical protein